MEVVAITTSRGVFALKKLVTQGQLVDRLVGRERESENNAHYSLPKGSPIRLSVAKEGFPKKHCANIRATVLWKVCFLKK